MSAQLRQARDHARRMVDQCAITVSRIEAELRLAVKMPGTPDPKGMQLARDLAARNRANGLLWSRIADEIEEYLERQRTADAGEHDQLDMFQEDH